MKYVAALVLLGTAVTVKAYNRPTTCRWPNTCNRATLKLPTLIQTNAIAQIQPCVWPNRCVTAL